MGETNRNLDTLHVLAIFGIISRVGGVRDAAQQILKIATVAEKIFQNGGHCLDIEAEEQSHGNPGKRCNIPALDESLDSTRMHLTTLVGLGLEVRLA